MNCLCEKIVKILEVYTGNTGTPGINYRPKSPSGDGSFVSSRSVFWCERRRFFGDLRLCVCRLKQLHQHQWSMRLPTCPPWEAVSHFCCFILLLPLLGQREQGEVCSCCSFPPDTTNPPPTRTNQTTKKPQKNHNKPQTINQSTQHCLLYEILLKKTTENN